MHEALEAVSERLLGTNGTREHGCTEVLETTARFLSRFSVGGGRCCVNGDRRAEITEVLRGERRRGIYVCSPSCADVLVLGAGRPEDE